MKVLLINTFDRWGAANACIRLHLGLLNSGIDSKLLVKHKSKDIYNSFEFNSERINKSSFWKKLLGFLSYYRILKFIYKRPENLEYFSYPDTKIDITNSDLYKEADIIHLHWVSDYIDYTSFFKLNDKPIVWTLHDMNPFSGGEHYIEKFYGLDELGFPKKRDYTIVEKELFKKIVEIKKKSIRSIHKINLVILNSWMDKEVKKSIFKHYPRFKIPNGISSEMFKLLSKTNCRIELNLPLDTSIVLFVADSLNNERKGFNYLKKVIDKHKFDDIIFCSVGEDLNHNFNSTNYKSFGRIEEIKLLNKIYCAADFFIIPSLIDNLPSTIIESFLSGTPVLGFPVGGIKYMIKKYKNGLLTESINVESLVNGIQKMLVYKDKFDSEKIREDALNYYSQENQIESYIKLYKEILDE
ncbi:glycosyltransferase [Urechidicola sp. KH5]